MAIMLAVLLLFWCRDYLILRMGPLLRTRARVGLYAGVVAGTTALLSVVAWRVGSSAVSRFIWSLPVLVSLIALHIAGGILCLWLKRSDRYYRVWLVALIPTPVAWFFFAGGVISRDFAARSFVVWLICALWIAAMFALVARTRRIEMPADELDFAVSLTGYSNFLGSFILIFFSSSYDVLSTPRF